jgi:excisionase family DNA binding protein
MKELEIITFSDNSVLSVKTLSKYLSVSESTIRKLVKSNEIPYLKIEGQYRFFMPRIHDWLDGKTIQVVSPGAVSKQALEISQKIRDLTIGVK